MGSVISSSSCMKFSKKFPRKIGSAPDDFTPQEINIIQKQWSVVMRNCDQVGYKLFER